MVGRDGKKGEEGGGRPPSGAPDVEHWGTCPLELHANYAAVQTMAVLIFLPSSVSSKLDRQSHQNPESNFI